MILFRKVDNRVRFAFFDIGCVFLDFGECFEAANEGAEALGLVAHDELETAAVFGEIAEGLGAALRQGDGWGIGPGG